MAQVDILNYFPILWWSILLLILFYFIIFTYLLPLLLATFKVRVFFFNELINSLLINNYFYSVFCLLYKEVSLKNIINIINQITYDLNYICFTQMYLALAKLSFYLIKKK